MPQMCIRDSQIPVWYCADCGKMTVSREDPTQCQHCGSENITPVSYTQLGVDSLRTGC